MRCQCICCGCAPPSAPRYRRRRACKPSPTSCSTPLTLQQTTACPARATRCSVSTRARRCSTLQPRLAHLVRADTRPDARLRRAHRRGAAAARHRELIFPRDEVSACLSRWRWPARQECMHRRPLVLSPFPLAPRPSASLAAAPRRCGRCARASIGARWRPWRRQRPPAAAAAAAAATAMAGR